MKDKQNKAEANAPAFSLIPVSGGYLPAIHQFG